MKTQHTHRLTTIVSAAAALLLLTATAPAATPLFSNIGQFEDGQEQGFDPGPSFMMASEFQTGASVSTITGLSAHITNYDEIAHTFSAFLYSDSGGLTPGSLLATFTALDNSVAAGGPNLELATFTHAGFALSANTQYWIALAVNETNVGDFAYWSGTTSNAVDPGSIFTNTAAPSTQHTTDTGASWADFGGTANRVFSLESTSVPEPSRALLLMGGVLSMALRRRRGV